MVWVCRGVGVQVVWCAGVVLCKWCGCANSVGMEGWCANGGVCRGGGVQIVWHVSGVGVQGVDVQTVWCAGVWVCK